MVPGISGIRSSDNIQPIVQIVKNSGHTYGEIRRHFIEGYELNRESETVLGMIPESDVPELIAYLDQMERMDARMIKFDRVNQSNTLASVKRNRDVEVSDKPYSAWQHYLKHLRDDGFENIGDIESASRNILELLSPRTEQGNPNRGAVIGNVQSGKTANMEALMSMACDNGWNFFVILSGTIDSLRMQTEDRMLNDLRRKEGEPLRYIWDKIPPKESFREFQRGHTLDFSEGSDMRFLSVILKNVTHIKRLIGNLVRLNNIERINLVVIDDEADLASINTKPDERTKINKLIINLIEGRDANGKKTPRTFNSVNYICYTATPYAVLLNESKGLYPADFITALTPSKRYFGLDRIFGSEKYDGMNIIKVRSDIQTPFSEMRGHPENMPNSMKDCIAWFICCTAVFRQRGDYNKPVSLLMNVDYKQESHRIVDEVVVDYLTNHRTDLINRCEVMYEERKNFTIEDLKRSVWDYGMEDSGSVYPEIRDFPPYESIRELVHEIVYAPPTRIEMDAEDNFVFNQTGIHVCVDNCKEQSDPISGEERYTCRLFYPEDNDSVLSNVPAFIVIGGNTLSRGLTIKGLVATYFRRFTIKQADSLLQMARWFGFRNGYELMPRIWMDSTTKSAFEALSRINEALFNEIAVMHEEGKTPRDYHLRIMQVPEANVLKSLTAANKRRGAVSTNAPDFSGNDKEFHDFYDDDKKNEENLRLTELFLKKIERYEVNSERKGYMFSGVPLKTVVEYLQSFITFENKSKRRADSPDYSIKWLSQATRGTADYFNVFLTGNVNPSDKIAEPVASFCDGKFKVNKIGRDCDEDKEYISIKTVRDKKDMLADIPEKFISCLSEDDRRELERGNVGIRNKVRTNAGLDHTPLLVIYVAQCNNRETSSLVLPSWHIPKGAKSNMKRPGDDEYVYLEEEG